MLYVKVDNAGNPIEVAKNYREIQAEYLAKNSIFPSENVLIGNSSRLGYALVPESEPLPPKAGSKVVPDVPIKNVDGTMTRKWKYEAVTSEDIELVASEMKARRQTMLRNLLDTISPMRWESWSESEKEEVKAFRQSLLDITSKEGWPFVTFEPIPSVLK